MKVTYVSVAVPLWFILLLGEKENIAHCRAKENGKHSIPRKNMHISAKCVAKVLRVLQRIRNICSHDCYIEDRFYKNEQMAYLIEQLKKGEKVEKTPQWIKDLLE